MEVLSQGDKIYTSYMLKGNTHHRIETNKIHVEVSEKNLPQSICQTVFYAERQRF